MSKLSIALCSDFRILRTPALFKSSDVIVFPELVDGGYRSVYTGKSLRRLDDPLIAELKTLTRNGSHYLIAGSLFLRKGSSSLNSSLVFHGGALIHRYDKVHLFRPARDHKFFSPGKRAGVFSIRSRSALVKAGIAICYDLRFPELIRSMAAQGMRLLLVPARWPRIRDDAWYTLLKARALENQAFVVGCNAKGSEGGYSYAFDPNGKLLFNGKTWRGKGVARVVLDLNQLATSRRLHDNLREARLLREPA